MVNRGQRMPVFLDINLPAATTNTYTVCGSAQVGSATTCANPVGTFASPFFTGARPESELRIHDRYLQRGQHLV